MADTSTIPSSMKAGLVGAGFSTTGYNGTIKIPDTSTITNKILNSDILFDRFINVILMTKNHAVANSDEYNYLSYPDDFQIITPRTGCKPDISLSFEFIPEQKVSSVTVTLKNVYLNLDINKYRYIHITAGYYSKDKYKQSFQGQIFNSYCEKPNPDGQVVFQCVLTDIVTLTKLDIYTVQFTEDEVTFGKFISTVLNSTGLNSIYRPTSSYGINNNSSNIVVSSSDIETSLPSLWRTATIFVSKKTYTFSSKLLVVNWLNSVIYRYMQKSVTLPPISFYLFNDNLWLFSVNSLTDDAMTSTGATNTVLTTSLNRVPLLNKVSNVYAQGYHVTIYAPWHPLILPMGLFAVPLSFMRQFINFNLLTELDALNICNLSGLLRAYSIQVNFSTTTTNQMLIDAIDLNGQAGLGDTSQGEDPL
jgi:hypothetical protein